MKLALALALLAAPAAAQLTAQVGPPSAPFGGRVVITFSNDTLEDYLVGQACPFEVRTPSGALVYDIDCPTFAAIPLPPGAAVSFFWEQYDNNFQQVPAGDYLVTAELPDGSTPTHAVTVGGDAGVHLQGTPKIGVTRGFWIEAPSVSFLPYLMAASTQTSPGIPTCAGVIPLFPNALFFESLNPGSAAFLGFAGTLGFQGFSNDPQLAIPNLPNLVGIPLSFSFVSIDVTRPCEVQTIAPATTVVIQA